MDCTMRLVFPRRSVGAKKSDRELAFHLFEPQESDICPISQGQMSDLDLDFLPAGATFSNDHKQLTGLRLATCKHTFNALHLVYHFVRNHTVQCPVCRAGPRGAHLSFATIPKHIRPLLTRKAKEQQRIDVQEQVQNDHETSISMTQEIQVIRLDSMIFAILQDQASTIINRSTVAIEIRGISGAGHLAPVTCLYFSDGRAYFMCSADPPQPRGAFQMLGCVNETRFPGSLFLENLPDGHNSLTAPHAACAYWAIYNAGAATSYIWSLPLDFFIYFAQSSGFD